MNVIVGSVQLDTCLLVEGDVVDSKQRFGEAPDLLTYKALVDGLMAEVNKTSNILLQRRMGTVTSIDLCNRKMTISSDETDTVCALHAHFVFGSSFGCFYSEIRLLSRRSKHPRK